MSTGLLALMQITFQSLLFYHMYIFFQHKYLFAVNVHEKLVS